MEAAAPEGATPDSGKGVVVTPSRRVASSPEWSVKGAEGDLSTPEMLVAASGAVEVGVVL